MTCCGHYAEASKDLPGGRIHVLNRLEIGPGGVSTWSTLPPVRYCPWCGENVETNFYGGDKVRPKAWPSATGRLMCVIGDEAYVAWTGHARALCERWPLADLERAGGER